MNRKDTLAWVMYVCSSLRLSQAKTLSQLVLAAEKMARTSLAELGRCLSASTFVVTKHGRPLRWKSPYRTRCGHAGRG